MSNTINLSERVKSLSSAEKQELAAAIVDELMQRHGTQVEDALQLPSQHRFRVFSAKPLPTIIINGERRT